MGEDPLRRVRHDTMLLCAFAALLTFGGAVVGATIIMLWPTQADSLWRVIVPEFTTAAAAVGGACFLGGTKLFAPSTADARTAVRLGWWALVVACGVAAIELAAWVSQGATLSDDWLVRLAELVFLCLLVGLFEEAFFRGIVFQGLLAWLGGTRRGVVRAVLLTSLVFGLMHVDISVAFVDASTVAQALLKTVQTGMFSFLLCVMVLRSQRLLGASLLHGIDDLVILVPSIVLLSRPFTTTYVSVGENATFTIVLYLITIALYLPFVIVAALELRRGAYATYGLFVERNGTPVGTPPPHPAPSTPPHPISMPRGGHGPMPVRPTGMPPATPSGMPPANPAGMPPATPAGMPPATPAGMPPANPTAPAPTVPRR